MNVYSPPVAISPVYWLFQDTGCNEVEGNLICVALVDMEVCAYAAKYWAIQHVTIVCSSDLSYGFGVVDAKQ